MSREKAIFIGATGQDVGKTTICLGIIAGLIKRFEKIGFIKPVGQQHVQIENGPIVDKDVVLFKKRFNLPHKWSEMSPVIIPKGFTQRFVKGEVDEKELANSIIHNFEKIYDDTHYTIVEGTGHIGVGSIINLNNAKVAQLLGLDMVIIVNGGLGSTIDALSLNIAMCKEYNVKIKGVIINRVLNEKREMVVDYVTRVLKKWKIPLLGAIPYSDFLSTHTMNDYESLFKTEMIAGEEKRYFHFRTIRLVAGSLEAYYEDFEKDELVITPATRLDIINAVVQKNGTGLILTGRQNPSKKALETIKESGIPTIYAPICSYDAMKMITSLISKTRIEDSAKVNQAIKTVEQHIDFSALD